MTATSSSVEELAKKLKAAGDHQSSFQFNLKYWREVAEAVPARVPDELVALCEEVITAKTGRGPMFHWDVCYRVHPKCLAREILKFRHSAAEGPCGNEGKGTPNDGSD